MSDPAVFRQLDFTSLWRGRDKVTGVEAGLVARALGGRVHDRLLEIGVGAGRLSAVARGLARRYVGVDLVRDFVGTTRRALGDAPTDLAVANVLRLPFHSASFDAALMIRVYNFFQNPVGALSEVRRVLVPGGELLLTCHTHPSLSSVVDDLKMGFHRQPGDGFRSMTCSHEEVVPVRPSLFASFSPTHRRLVADLARGGFSVEAEWGAGFEDLAPSGWLPPKVYLDLAGWRPVVALASVRFVLAKADGRPPAPATARTDRRL